MQRYYICSIYLLLLRLILETKKNIGADIERWRVQSFLLGLIVVLAFLVVALEMTFSAGDAMMSDSDVDEPDFEMMISHDDESDMVAVPQKQVGLVSPDRVVAAPREIDNWENRLLRDISQVANEKPQVNKEKLEEVKQTIMPNEPVDYHVVDQLPEFPGGMAALVAWLTDNLKYPSQALRGKKEGMVEVQFVINIDGSVSDFTLQKKSDENLNREAMRVVSSMPKWEKSGKYQGKPCRTLFVIPIVFDI